MIRPGKDLERVYIYRHAVDMRRGINGLVVLVESVLSMDPLSSQLFVFCNRKRDLVKMVWWERNGFCLWMKKLEKERFKWPKHHDEEVITLNGQQLNFLLDGYDLSVMKPHRSLYYRSVL
jgi:transposase